MTRRLQVSSTARHTAEVLQECLFILNSVIEANSITNYVSDMTCFIINHNALVRKERMWGAFHKLRCSNSFTDVIYLKAYLSLLVTSILLMQSFIIEIMKCTP